MPKSHRLPLIPISIVLILVFMALFIMWFKPNNQDNDYQVEESIPSQTTPSIASSSQDSQSQVNAESSQLATRFNTGTENLPRSLQGTEVDGEIIVDQNKQLVVTEGLRRLFDYFLSASGEEDEATIIARVEAYISSHTPEPAASQAIEIFHNYVAYLKAIPALDKQYGNLQLRATKSGALDINAVEQKKRDVSQLRQQYFDRATIEAFFGDDDQYDDYSMSLIKIDQDPQMTSEQKEAAKQDYISRMPDNEIKASVQQQANLNELLRRTEQMKAEGASAQDLFEMRKALVGAPAAQRLANLDAENANFDQRFQHYQQQKQVIQRETGSQAQVQKQIEQLETQLFSETERKRLSGYAALQQQKSQQTQ